MAVYFLIWPQAGPRRCSYRVCNRGVLNRDFSEDSGTQCLLVYLVSSDTVGQGRSCFSLTNNYKLNVFGSFLVHPDLKDFKSCSLLVSFW